MSGSGVFDAYAIKNQNKLITVPPGVTILSEGEVNLDMYKVISGHIEMYTGYGTENEVLLGILGPGSCFGEFGILLRKQAIYTIISFSEVKLLRVTEGALGDFVQENSDCIIQILRNMANMMAIMQQNIELIASDYTEMCKAKVDEVIEKIPDFDENWAKVVKKDMLRKYAVTGKYYFSRK
ncbi:MAG: Crp/Fnr family transcriptional regulator [Lachnospiraceae bacterium]|nr:Crp/Fnr family transcriptional regulator [Lachnospiraceae bacterium]